MACRRRSFAPPAVDRARRLNMLNYDHVKNRRFEDVVFDYTERDTMLYALGLGVGADPTDPQQLAFVYEQGKRPLCVMPSMAAILALPGQWVREQGTGIDWVRLVHGEERIRIHRPLPPSGRVIGRMKVTHVADKGRGKGAIVQSEREVFDATDGALLATVKELRFCRGDGGYSEDGQPSDPLPDALQAVPASSPDRSWSVATRPDQALIYRLSGDFNPLHADPDVARAAGYERPILHGLATYGLACRAIVESWCGGDALRLRGLDVRFTTPVFPGDEVRVDMWRTTDGVAFQAVVPQRQAVVLNNGRALLVE